MSEVLLQSCGDGPSGLPTVFGVGVGQLIYNTDFPDGGLDVSGYAMIVTHRSPIKILFPQKDIAVITGTSANLSVTKVTTQYDMDNYQAYDPTTKKMISTLSSSSYMFYYK